MRYVCGSGYVPDGMAQKTTSIRLDEDGQRLLDALVKDLGGMSQSAVIRLALRDLAKARGLIETKKVKE